MLKDQKISKYLSNLGFTNRRASKNYISENKIFVNSKLVKSDIAIKDNDIIEINGSQHIADLSAPLEVIMYHKPLGQICSNASSEKNDSVFKNLPTRKKGKWIMIGRLDINTSGLLLFSNNGDFSNMLSHPSSGIDREYLCRVYGDISNEKISKLLKGVKINGLESNFSDIVEVKKKRLSKNHWFYVCLFSGKNREVRKLWATQELTVNRLIRLRYGSIELPKTLKPGEWKKVNNRDIQNLKKIYKVI